jgi:hypothetical protein
MGIMTVIFHWLDVIIFLLLLAVHIGGWLERRKDFAEHPLDGLEDRVLAATALNSASVAGVTAVSILIPASLLIVQIAFDKTGFPRQALEDVFRASVWFLVSLVFGLVLIFLIPMQCPKHNVTRILLTGIPFGPQLIALLIGVIWFVIGIYFAVFDCGGAS